MQWGSLGGGNGQFVNPTDVAVDAIGNIFVMDGTNQRVQKFTSTGAYLTQWGSYGTGDGAYLTQWGSPGRDAGQFILRSSS